MHIHVTDAAERELSRVKNGSGTLKLVYDTDGCGCAVNGLAQLWIVQKATLDDADTVAAETNGSAIIYEKRQDIFFDERMTLDYDSAQLSFLLKSDGQIFNPRMRITDKRERNEVR